MIRSAGYSNNTPRSRRRRPPGWQHPAHHDICVPHKVAAALAVIEMGIHDHQDIGDAVGLSLDEIAVIDRADDHNVRRLGVLGIPFGQFFNLRAAVRCPRCEAWVTVAPCVACDQRVPQFEETC